MIPVSQRDRHPTSDGRPARVRFQSNKKRSQQASANVYRHVKQKLLTSNSAAQEERVHHAAVELSSSSNKQKDAESSATRRPTERMDDEAAGSELSQGIDAVESDLCETTGGTSKRFQSSAFADELDIVLDRNPSEIFVKFHRQVWPLVRSLPELLHHASQVVDLILSSLLTEHCYTREEEAAAAEEVQDVQKQDSNEPMANVPPPGIAYYSPNLATNDLLHLLAVFARDVRQEIHPYLHTRILPRLVTDLLRPPPIPVPTSLPLETVETVFRTMAYVFKYDATPLLAEVKGSNGDGTASSSSKDSSLPCLELLRQYYGGTLAHRNPLVRRLAGETFAPVIRRLPTDKAQSKHLKRVVRSLMSVAAQGEEGQQVQRQKNPVPEFSTSIVPRSRRLQVDAADGIAGLLWEVARGVKGQFHSRGENVVLSSLLDCMQSASRRDRAALWVVAEVTTGFLHRALPHLDAAPASKLMQSLVDSTLTMANSIESMSGDNERDDSLTCLVQALHQGAAFRRGFVLQTQPQLQRHFLQLLNTVLAPELFSRLSSACQLALIKLICCVWGAVPESQQFADSICNHLRRLLKLSNNTNEDALSPLDATTVSSLAAILTTELLMRLPVERAMSQVGSLLISAVGSLAKCTSSLDDALPLMHSIVLSTRAFRPDGQDSDCFFDHSCARYCSISESDRDAIVRSWMVDYDLGDGTMLDRLAEVVPCLTFVILIKRTKDAPSQELSKWGGKVMEWLLGLAEFILASDGYSGTDELSTKFSVALSLILESLASLLHAFDADECGGTARSRQVLRRVRIVSEKHMMVKTSSHWAMRSVAAVFQVLSQDKLKLDMDSNLIFEALVPNLSRSNHFLRLHTLVILASLPERPFVTDHSDIDWTGDLDEDPSARPFFPEVRTGPSGMSDVPKLLLKIESITPSLDEERAIISQIGVVEILGKTGKLPAAYAEAAAAQMLGVLHCKFAPLWPAAIRAIVSLTAAHEDVVRPLLLQVLVAVVDVTPGDASTQLSGTGKLDDVSHLDCRVAWEVRGDPGLFLDDLEQAKEVGRVSWHESTDAVTIFEYCWEVIEKAPRIMTTQSQRFVDLFLRFIFHQHLRGDVDDPDARELQPHLETVTWEADDCRPVHPKWAVQRRLQCMLKAFAAVKAPQQLYQSPALRRVFVSLLGNSDDSISRLACRCIMRYKDSKLASLSPVIDKLYEKGKLRESLLQLKTQAESGEITSDVRKTVTPFLARILLGRVSAKAVVKSTKDSPAARRNAVLEFANSFCVGDKELFTFIYLTVRAYMSSSISSKRVDDDDEDECFQDMIFEELCKLSPDDVIRFPPARHQGFLNMLEAVLDQLGQRVTKYMRAFVAIILAISRAHTVKSKEAEELTEINESDDLKSSASRSSTIRALCFRRLAGIFQQYHASIDLSSFSEDLWDSFRSSVPLLPEMALNSDHAPAILHCFVALSAHRDLVAFLETHDDITSQVMRCLGAKSSASVVDLVLSFIENLLGVSDDATGTAPSLICRHARCFLVQFHTKLEVSNIVPKGGSERMITNIVSLKSWRRELAILSRLSLSLVQKRDTVDNEDSEVFETLVSVLQPLLEQQKNFTSTDHLNILEILHSIVPRVTDAFAADFYNGLSRLFGLGVRGRPRPHSKEVHRSISSLLLHLTQTVFVKGARCASAAGALCALRSNRVDELDYDKVLAALNQLSERASWVSLCSIESDVDPNLLSPLVQLCFHYLYDTDGVIARSAFSSLKVLVSVAADECHLLADAPVVEDEQITSNWMKFLQGSVISCVRNGLHGRDESVRRFFVLIMRQVAISCRGSSSPHLYGDLAVLASEEDPDLDFYSNITHVQVHRRARALQRLRKALVSNECAGSEVAFSMHSLSNVLLPIALHPVYETKTTTEESLALEAIATVGAIARNLSWNKYNTLLHNTLNQFHRHVEQERFVVGLLCAIIDAFHFDLDSGVSSHSNEVTETSAVLRGLEMRIVPKVERLLVKEKVDKHGRKVEVLRPSITLALLKLFQKLPAEQFRLQVPRLLTVVCGALRSRESDARDAARSTLAKMASTMDVMYLPDVIRELALSLTEGYQLHVRCAAIHSILLAITESGRINESPSPADQGPFIDLALPGLMDLLQQDLFGEAQERLDANGSQVRYVKEAGGSKSYHSLELMAQLICFNNVASVSPLRSGSSVHILVSPFLERLRDPKMGSNLIRRVRECLARLVRGFSCNPSLSADAIFPIAYSSLSPFIQPSEINEVLTVRFNEVDDNSDADDAAVDTDKQILVSGGISEREKPQDKSRAKRSVAEWIPSALAAHRSADQARKAKHRTEQEFSRVHDGRNAPKLTGSNRLKPVSMNTFTLNFASNASAVMFGLQLLHAGLKRFKQLSDDDCKRHLDPFVPLLATCVCVAKDLDVVALALKCVSVLLRLRLPSMSRCTGSLASKCLEFLTSSGSSSNQSHEILHASFKLISTLLDCDSATLLTSEQLQVLTSYLQGSLLESDHHTMTVNVIRSIVARKLVSPELYDLMEKLLEQSVRDMTSSLRQQSSSVFVSYLLDYPLSPERVEQHLKQVVLNVKYEYPEGRLAAVAVISTLLDRLPIALIEQHAQLFFLPLTLQLVSDDSEKCRESISRAICQLLVRLPYDHQSPLCDYAVRWSEDSGDLKRTGIQLLGLMVDACPETLHRRSLGARLGGAAQSALDSEAVASGWEVPYFALVLVEKTLESPTLATNLRRRPDLWASVIQCLFSFHPWIRLVSSRVAVQQLGSADLEGLVSVVPGQRPTLTSPLVECAVEQPGTLFAIARGFCHILGLEESEQDDSAAGWAIRGVTAILPVMQEMPHLCFADNEPDSRRALRRQERARREDGDGDDAPKDEGTSESPRRDPVEWVLTRLAATAKRKGSQRRQAVFKTYAALVTRSEALVRPYLELLLEPLYRSEVEARNESELSDFGLAKKPSAAGEGKATDSQLAKGVLQLIEETLHAHGAPDAFVQAYAAVKARASARKARRKVEEAAEVVRSPQAAAQRRVHKQEREKRRRKRRVDDQRLGRGATAKRRQETST